MRLLLGLVLPLLLQAFLYVVVFIASRGGGSFMGLLAMPVAGLTVLVLLTAGWQGARSQRPLGAVMLTNLAIAVLPPLLLLVVRALER